MFTKIYLFLRHYPAWLKSIKTKDVWYWRFVWLWMLSFIFSLFHFFTLRNDWIYGFLLLVIPLSSMLFSLIRSFAKKQPKETERAFLSQGIPMAISLSLVNLPMLFYSHQSFASDQSGTLFLAILFGVTASIFWLVCRRFPMRVARAFLIGFNALSLVMVAILTILGVTL